MIDARLLLHPGQVEDALTAVLRSEIVCVYERGEVRVDTPYVLQDGAMFRLFLRVSEDGHTLVGSDGGYAATQIDIFTRDDALVEQRYAAMAGIARQVGLEWDVEFRFAVDSLEAAARRIASLARAVDRALSLIYTPPVPESQQRRTAGSEPLQAQPAALRLPLPLKEPVFPGYLGAEMLRAGFRVAPKAKILAGRLPQPVRIDYRIQRRDREAAVEILTGRNPARALAVVDRTVADFHLLARADYKGLLVAVYDEDSPAAQTRLLERFRSASPERSLLVGGSQAVSTLLERFAA